MHPRIYSTTDIGRAVDGHLRGIGRTTAYRQIDAYEAIVRQGIVDMVPLRSPGSGGIYHDRDEIELGLSYARHVVSGRWSFRFGKDLVAKLQARTRSAPPPLAPTAPVYLELDGCDLEYAPGRILKAAYVSRGEVGAITFLSSPTSSRTRGDAMTVLLPNSLRVQDVLSLAECRLVEWDETPDALIERALAQTLGDGPTGELAPIAVLNEQVSECGFPKNIWPEAPLCAAFALVCASYAREADSSYAAPVYQDHGPLSRNWTSGDEHPEPDVLDERERLWRSGDDLMIDVR